MQGSGTGGQPTTLRCGTKSPLPQEPSHRATVGQTGANSMSTISSAPHPFGGRQGGSLAERAYQRHNPSAVRFGHDLPRDRMGELFRLDRMPSIARSLPDFMTHEPFAALVEAQGGKHSNGWITVKTRKLDELLRHGEHFCVTVIVWTYLSDTDSSSPLRQTP